MDTQRIMHGKATFGDQQVNLGRATISALLIRFAQSLKPVSGQLKGFTLEFHVDEITGTTAISRANMIEHELESSIIKTDEIEEEWRPGISFETMGVAITSDSYQAYSRALDTPGFDQDQLNELRKAYEAEWPDVSKHLPNR